MEVLPELVLLPEAGLQPAAVQAYNTVESELAGIDIPELADTDSKALSAVHIVLFEVLLVQLQVL